MYIKEAQFNVVVAGDEINRNYLFMQKFISL